VGWGRGGREAQAGGDICILTADTHCCMAETNTHYKAIVLQLKINLKRKFSNLRRKKPSIFIKTLKTWYCAPASP